MNDRAIREFARTLEKKIQKEMRGISVPVTADNPVPHGGELDTNTPLGLLGAQLLDWLYARRHNSFLSSLRQFLNESKAKFRTESDSEERELQLIDQVDILSDMGLLKVERCLGGDRLSSDVVRITDAGVRNVIQRQQLQQDKHARISVCRRNVLRWLYEQQESHDLERIEISQILQSPWGNIAGHPFTRGELTSAFSYLQEKEFVEGNVQPDGTIYKAHLTEVGIDCVENHEGWVSEYMKSNREGGVSFINNFNSTVSNMQLGQAGRDVVQQQTIEGLDTKALVVLARALREASPHLGMNEGSIAEINRVADQLELVAQEENPNPERLRGILGWGRDVLANASGSYLGAVLTSVISSLIGG